MTARTFLFICTCPPPAVSHIENLVRLETRDANAEGAGAIGIGELIRAALRTVSRL